MSSNSQRPPIYPLAMPMQIGHVQAKTSEINLEEVVFDSPVPFAAGGAIEFSVLLGRDAAAVRIECKGRVLRCEATSLVRFRAAASIEALAVVREQELT